MGEESPTTTAWSKESSSSASVTKQPALEASWSGPLAVPAAFSEGGSTSADWTEALSFVYSPDNLPVLTSDGEYVYVRG